MEKKEDFYIPEEIAEWIGMKKSEYLSQLILKAEADDIGFEEYHLYDSYIPDTIENPDKAYEDQVDGYLMRIYLKTRNQRGSFHQVVLGVVIDDAKTKAQVFVPVLSFVSRKDQIVKEFCTGNVISHQTLN